MAHSKAPTRIATAKPGFNSRGYPSKGHCLKPGTSGSDNNEYILSQQIISLEVPQYIIDVADWVRDMGEIFSWESWEEIYEEVPIPTARMMVLPHLADADAPESTVRERIRCALILARCNSYQYVPDGPAIFTRSRLHRSIRLVTLNLETYYDVE